MNLGHENIDRVLESEGSSDRSFGLVFSVFFTLVALLPLVSGGRGRFWALGPAGAFLLAALLRPSLLTGLNRLWTKVGLLLHRVVSPVTLAILYFVVLTPFALAMRCFRRDPLNLSRDPRVDSYWIARERGDVAGRGMRNQF